LEEAFGKLAEIDFDAVALAGGPRLLVVLAFLAAMYKGRGVYVVPEYDPEPIDVSHLARLPSISALSPTRLRILASLDGDKTYREVASDVGVDSSTALRHLEGLRRLGLVERAGGRLPRYRAGPAVVRLSRVLLRIKSRRSL
jgi:CRISPR-associated protein Csa3